MDAKHAAYYPNTPLNICYMHGIGIYNRVILSVVRCEIIADQEDLPSLNIVVYRVPYFQGKLSSGPCERQDAE